MPDAMIVLVTLISYKIILVLIGLWAQRRVKSEKDFFLAGQGLGPWVAAVSYSASAASAWTLLGMSGLAYSVGLSALWVAMGAVIGCAISWWLLAPRIMTQTRNGRILSATEFIASGTEGRQRHRIIVLVSAIILFCLVVYIASQFQGAGNTFASTFGIGNSESILLGGIIILVYTLLGGFWAVSVTDTLQGLLMMFTAILLPAAAVTHLGGIHEFWLALHEATDSHYMSATGNSLGLTAAGLIVGSMMIGVSSFGQPHLVARFMALKDTRALRQGQIIATAWYAIVFFGMCLVGFSGRILLGEIDTTEQVFFSVNNAIFPTVMGAILLAAVLSAIMSTADSMLLVCGTTVAHDLGINQRHRSMALQISRLAIAAISVLAILVAIWIPATIFQRVLFAWVALGAALGPTVVCRALGVELSSNRLAPAITAGFLTAIVCHLLPDTPGDIVERCLPFVLGLTVLVAPARKTKGGSR